MMFDNDDNSMIIDTRMEKTEDENISCKSLSFSHQWHKYNSKQLPDTLVSQISNSGDFYAMLPPSIQIPIYENPAQKTIPLWKLQLSGKYLHRTCLCVGLYGIPPLPIFSDDESGKLFSYIHVNTVVPAIFYSNKLINSHFNLFSCKLFQSRGLNTVCSHVFSKLPLSGLLGILTLHIIYYPKQNTLWNLNLFPFSCGKVGPVI